MFDFCGGKSFFIENDLNLIFKMFFDDEFRENLFSRGFEVILINHNHLKGIDGISAVVVILIRVLVVFLTIDLLMISLLDFAETLLLWRSLKVLDAIGIFLVE